MGETLEQNKQYMKLSQAEALHLAELAYQNFTKGCTECEDLKKKLKKVIGEKDWRWMQRIIKKNPYEN